MKNKIRPFALKGALVIAIVLLIISCAKHDYIIPDAKVEVIITIPPGEAPLPEDFVCVIVNANGDTIAIFTPGKPVNVPPGVYQVVATDLKDAAVTVTGTVASLAVDDSGLVPSAPNFSASASSLVVADNNVSFQGFVIRPMTREVKLQFKMAGIAASEISDIKVALYGVATSVDMSTGFGHAAKKTATRGTGITRATDPANYHVQGTCSTAGDVWTVTFRLMGVNSEVEQKVAFAVLTTDGMMKDFSVPATELLKDFNSGEPTLAALLEGTLSFSPGLNGDINPWTPGLSGEIEGQ